MQLKSTSLYLIVRLFTSSYLFLSGYGHFMYYWNTSNYSISRFFEVSFKTAALFPNHLLIQITLLPLGPLPHQLSANHALLHHEPNVPILQLHSAGHPLVHLLLHPPGRLPAGLGQDRQRQPLLGLLIHDRQALDFRRPHRLLRRIRRFFRESFHSAAVEVLVRLVRRSHQRLAQAMVQRLLLVLVRHGLRSRRMRPEASRPHRRARDQPRLRQHRNEGEAPPRASSTVSLEAHLNADIASRLDSLFCVRCSVQV